MTDKKPSKITNLVTHEVVDIEQKISQLIRAHQQSLEDEIKKLRTSIKNLERKLEAARDAKKESDKQVAMKSKEVLNRDQQIVSLTCEIKRLKSSSGDKDAQEAKLRTELTTLTTELNQLREVKSNTDKDQATLKLDLANRDQRIEELTTQIRNLKRDVEERDEKIVDIEAQLKNVKDNLETMKNVMMNNAIESRDAKCSSFGPSHRSRTCSQSSILDSHISPLDAGQMSAFYNKLDIHILDADPNPERTRKQLEEVSLYDFTSRKAMQQHFKTALRKMDNVSANFFDIVNRPKNFGTLKKSKTILKVTIKNAESGYIASYSEFRMLIAKNLEFIRNALANHLMRRDFVQFEEAVNDMIKVLEDGAKFAPELVLITDPKPSCDSTTPTAEVSKIQEQLEIANKTIKKREEELSRVTQDYERFKTSTIDRDNGYLEAMDKKFEELHSRLEMRKAELDQREINLNVRTSELSHVEARVSKEGREVKAKDQNSKMSKEISTLKMQLSAADHRLKAKDLDYNLLKNEFDQTLKKFKDFKEKVMSDGQDSPKKRKLNQETLIGDTKLKFDL